MASDLEPTKGAADAAIRSRNGDAEAVDYQALVEQIPAITYARVHDPRQASGRRTTYVSPQAARILGRAPADFVTDQELWIEIRHPADRAAVHAAERTAEITRRPFHAEYRVIARDGRTLWMRDDAVIVDGGNGTTIWRGMMSDVTAEKSAEEHARKADLRYRSLVESLPAIVYIDELNERATNVYTSSSTERLIGYTVQDWRDNPDLWATILHPDDLDRCIEHQAHHVATGEPFEETYRVIARDGRTLWIHDVAVVVRDEDGTPLYSQGFLLDITAQKEAELALQQALERLSGDAPAA